METPIAFFRMILLENKERVLKVVAPRPGLFPHAHAKVGARVERAHSTGYCAFFILCRRLLKAPSTPETTEKLQNWRRLWRGKEGSPIALGSDSSCALPRPGLSGSGYV